MEHERWVEIDLLGFVSRYMVSSLGRIKSCDCTKQIVRRGKQETHHYPGRILRQQINSRGSGYFIVSLQIGDGSRRKVTKQVAPLICQAFNGPRPSEDMHCAHLNGNSQDNRPENLAWVSRKENEAHKVAHGTKMRGERHHQAVLTPEQVRQIREAPRGYGTGVRLAREYGVTQGCIWDIRHKSTWRHLP